MATVHDEVEKKYDAGDGFEVPSLVELFGQTGDGPVADGTPLSEGQEEQELVATYFDTAALDLTGAGLTLRRRTGGDDAGWHLKVPGVGGSRSEIRLPLTDEDDPATSDAVPEQLRRMTYARTGGTALIPVARIVTRRTVRRLLDPTGRVLVEVCDDRVTALRLPPLGTTNGSTGEESTWREIEVELVEGPPDLLSRAEPLLLERGLTPARATSKVARALTGGAGAPLVGDGTGDDRAPAGEAGTSRRKRAAAGSKPARSASAADVALRHLATQLEQIRAQDLPVRLDAPGAVHAMRVATRRLRSALTTFGPLFRTGAVRPVGRELKWLAGVLGVARDAEVMRDRVNGALQDEDEAARLQPTVTSEVSDQLDDAYRSAHDRVVAELDGERYRALLDSLRSLVEAPPLKPRAGRRARTVLPVLVLDSYSEVREAMRSADDATDPEEREVRLHDARKAAKRSRYAGEAVASVFGKDALSFAAAMEKVQEALGEHLDSINTRTRLRELASETSVPSTAFTYGRLHAVEEIRVEASRGDADAAWEQASKKRLRRWLR